MVYKKIYSCGVAVTRLLMRHYGEAVLLQLLEIQLCYDVYRISGGISQVPTFLRYRFLYVSDYD
tara:strand:+ start:451 stop:642 length:192 start_codon:yes stop_codon:yes gene_type:complete